MTLLPGTDQIEGERIILRRILPSDLDYFAEIHADSDVARHIGAGNPRPRTETTAWLDDVLESYARASLGQLAVVRKIDGAPIGRCGLSDAAIETAWDGSSLRKGWFFSRHVPSAVDIERLPELGYTFGKASWGQGYASEAAACLYRYARTALSFPKIMSVIHPENVASRAVALKFGVTYIDQVELAGRAFDRYHWPMSGAQL